MMIIPESQIRALIRLLSDEDDRIVRTISGKLIDIGPSAVPLLQEAEIEQPEMADRIASVLEEIRGGKLEDELAELAALETRRRAGSAVDDARRQRLLAELEQVYGELDEVHTPRGGGEDVAA